MLYAWRSYLPPVDSNDNLYAGDPKFVGEVALLVNTVLSQILDHMKELSTSEEVCVCGWVGSCLKHCACTHYYLPALEVTTIFNTW